MTEPEHAHRRRDEDDEDQLHFHHREVARERSHTRWVVTVVSAALISSLGWFAIENYRLVNDRIADQKADIDIVQRQVNNHEAMIAEMRANQQNMLAAQKRIEEKIDVLVARVHKENTR